MALPPPPLPPLLLLMLLLLTGSCNCRCPGATFHPQAAASSSGRLWGCAASSLSRCSRSSLGRSSKAGALATGAGAVQAAARSCSAGSMSRAAVSQAGNRAGTGGQAAGSECLGRKDERTLQQSQGQAKLALLQSREQASRRPAGQAARQAVHLIQTSAATVRCGTGPPWLETGGQPWALETPAGRGSQASR